MSSISNLFQGRIGRGHFAWAMLAFVGVAIAVNILTYAFALLGDSLGMLASIVSFLVFLAMAVVSLGVTVRRYHDMDWSTWFILLSLIPFVNIVMLIILLIKQGTPGSNRFGAPFAKEVPLKEAILNKGRVASTAVAQTTGQASPVTGPASGEPAMPIEDTGAKGEL